MSKIEIEFHFIFSLNNVCFQRRGHSEASGPGSPASGGRHQVRDPRHQKSQPHVTQATIQSLKHDS